MNSMTLNKYNLYSKSDCNRLRQTFISIDFQRQKMIMTDKKFLLKKNTRNQYLGNRNCNSA